MELDVDWNSTDNKYHTRLVLGKASDIVTDIRFAVAGYIENIHTAWFGENSSAPPYQASHGAKITTYLSGGNVTDLVFFDPQNASGKTLTQLAAGGAGTDHSTLSNLAFNVAGHTGSLPMGSNSISGVTELIGTTTQNLTLQSGTGRSLVLMADGQDVSIWDSSLSANFDSSAITFYRDLDMENHDVIDVKVIKAYSTNNLSFWDNTNGTKTLSELAAGGGGDSLWQDDVDYAWLTTSKHINLQDKSIIGIQSLKSFDTDGIRHHDSSDASAFTIAPIVSTVTYAWRAWADGRMEGNDIIMGTGKITGLAAGTVSGDAVALDGDGYVPILDLPLGGTGVRGDLLVGTNAGCSTIQAGTNGLVLTADSAQTAGVKWAAVGAGSGLWQSTGTPARTSLIATQPIDLYDDIDMHGKDIDNLYRIDAHDASGVGLYDHNGSWRAVLANPSYAMQCLNAGIDMNDTQKITSLVAGSGAGDSVRYEQVLLLAGGTMNSEAGINMSQGTLTNVGGLSLYDSSDYIDMSGGDIVDVVNVKGKYGEDVELYGSNTAGDAYLRFLQWSKAAEYTKLERVVYIGSKNNTSLTIYQQHGGADYAIITAADGGDTWINTSGGNLNLQPSDMWIRFYKATYPTSDNTYQLGHSSYRWSHVYGVAFHQGDQCYSEKSCAKCGKDFQVGDAIVHVVIERDSIGGDTCTIPIHASCAQKEKQIVEIERHVEDVVEVYMEDDGTIGKHHNPRMREESYNKLILKDGIKKDKDGFYVRDGKRLAKDEIFDVVESTREIPVMVKKKYLI
jgi:hypothetical protein